MIIGLAARDSIRRMDADLDATLLHTVADGVATVVISHPAKRNAMTASMWRALPELLTGLARDPAVRALVLTGAGPTFCAGADISSLTGDEDPRALAVTAEEALAAFPKPTLAAVRGFCVGGGSQLAAACDLRFAEEGASFGVTPAKLGIVYPASSTRRLASLVGPAWAKYLLFSAELIGADQALRAGFLNELPLGRAAGQEGRRVHPDPRLALAADAGCGQGVRGRPDGPGRALGRPGGGERRRRGGRRRVPGAPGPRFTWTT